MERKNRVGEKFITNEGYKIEIVECFGSLDCTVQFENGFKLKNRQYSDIKKGEIKNPYHKSVYNLGCIGEGTYKVSVGGKTTTIYTTWRSMLERCYSERYQKKFPTYIGCSVDKRWHNFQIFAKWFEENYKKGFDLDKDILIRGNKTYSPETCCFVPREINYVFTKSEKTRGDYPIGVSRWAGKFRAQICKNGSPVYLGVFKTPEKAFQVYKKAKEKELKELARFYKKDITKEAYQAIINYKVEIDD